MARLPARLCDAAGVRGLVYSRPGYGRSTPRAADERWGLDFMHRQAHEVLPALLAALGIDADARPPWLFGHSDGGSIALLYAARFPQRVAGAVVLAPHIVVEDLSVASIEKARVAYLRRRTCAQRLAQYHDDPDSAFWGWNDIWLHRRSAVDDRGRDRRHRLPAARDAGPRRRVRHAGADPRHRARACRRPELLELPACGHSRRTATSPTR